MELVSGKIRKMRDELKNSGTPRDTDEIRETYDLKSLIANITLMPENETQNPHKHFLVMEAIHVLAGEVEVLHDGTWEKIREKQIAIFGLNEYHNVRTLKRKNMLTFPNATNNISAVTIAYKWIPPNIDIQTDEIDIVLKNDWFHERFDRDNDKVSSSPLFKQDKEIQNKFWNIVKRNNK